VDGFAPIRPNAAGTLPALLRETGFIDAAAPFMVRKPARAITL
jgi:hypothetical protein